MKIAKKVTDLVGAIMAITGGIFALCYAIICIEPINMYSGGPNIDYPIVRAVVGFACLGLGVALIIIGSMTCRFCADDERAMSERRKLNIAIMALLGVFSIVSIFFTCFYVVFIAFTIISVATVITAIALKIVSTCLKVKTPTATTNNVTQSPTVVMNAKFEDKVANFSDISSLDEQVKVIERLHQLQLIDDAQYRLALEKLLLNYKK